MNGSNSLEEEDVIPFHLCPVCLRKLHFSIGFDVSMSTYCGCPFDYGIDKTKILGPTQVFFECWL